MRNFSLIIPVFNRPDEVEDLLRCLSQQSYSRFEVIIVESGSTVPSDEVVEKYRDKVNVKHFMYRNDGQGFSRNYGMKQAEGDFFVILDSDILLDPDYLENLDRELDEKGLDAFGGPDKAHPSFTPLQKAVDHVMTSVLTTGGIRGKEKRVGQFYPRSFNMGFSREVHERVGGFDYPFFGEDLDLSQRIMDAGFRVGLIPEAYVYHKRKDSFKGHFRQMFFFGRARIKVSQLYPSSLKVTHFFPSAFVIYQLFLLFILIPYPQLAGLFFAPILLYILAIGGEAMLRYHSILPGLLAVPAVYTQMFGYGLGFMKDLILVKLMGRSYEVKNKEEEKEKEAEKKKALTFKFSF